MNRGSTQNVEYTFLTELNAIVLAILVSLFLNILVNDVVGQVFTPLSTTTASAYDVGVQEKNQKMPKRGERRLVNIYLNRELYLTAKSDAAKQDITMQEWVEDALRLKLKSDGVEVEQDPRTSSKD